MVQENFGEVLENRMQFFTTKSVWLEAASTFTDDVNSNNKHKFVLLGIDYGVAKLLNVQILHQGSS